MLSIAVVYFDEFYKSIILKGDWLWFQNTTMNTQQCEYHDLLGFNKKKKGNAKENKQY